MSEPSSQSAATNMVGFYAVLGGVDPREVIVSSRVFGAVEVRGGYELGIRPYIFPVRDGNAPD